jgi:hypothetical protein
MRSRTSLLATIVLLVGACGGSPGASSSAPAGATAPGTAPGPTASPAPTERRPATAAPTGATAETPTPTSTPPPIGIIGVECLGGQTVRLHVSITDARGVTSYQVWSTWGGGGETTRSFPTPYPTHIDERIELTHALVDPEPRVHQFGLAVTLVGLPDPILTYATEPDSRCPGH